MDGRVVAGLAVEFLTDGNCRCRVYEGEKSDAKYEEKDSRRG